MHRNLYTDKKKKLVPLLERFALACNMTINVSKETIRFLMVFSGFEHWPGLYASLVDDDAFSTEEISIISTVQSRILTFIDWYSLYFNSVRTQLETMEAKPSLKWSVFLKIFRREDPRYRSNKAHISAMYLTMYHNQSVPGLEHKTEKTLDDEDAFVSDSKDGEWLRLAIGEYQLMAETVTDIQEFYKEHPNIDVASLLFLARCVCASLFK